MLFLRAVFTLHIFLTATPIAHSPAPLTIKKQRKLGVKLSPGKRERQWQEILSLISHYPTDLTVNNIISPGQVCFAHDGIGE